MPSVFYCSPTNSTHFTTCCQVAICEDQQKCPRCKEDVYPFHEDMSPEERTEAAGGYWYHNTRSLRDQAARRTSSKVY